MATTNSNTTASELFGTTSPVSGSAPTTDGTDGQPLQDLDAITVVIDTGSGVTLSGAGTLDCYVWDTSVALWSPYAAGNFTVNGTTRTQAFEAVEVLARRNSRIKWIPTGVTFSAGSAGVTVYQLGYGLRARGAYP